MNRLISSLHNYSGGTFEHSKAAQLSMMLQVPVHPDQVVLAHTPLRQLGPAYRNKLVLVTGNEDVPGVAHSYGFQHAVGVNHFLRREPSLWPHTFVNTPEGRTALRFAPMPSPSHPFHTSTVADVEAVMVFYDGIDWGAEMQVITDVLMRGREYRFQTNRPVFRADNDRFYGDIGAESTPDRDPFQPLLIFTNNDFVWKNEQELPRYAQGTFRMCLQAAYEKLSGRPLFFTQFGKPANAQYDYGESVLMKFAASLSSGSSSVSTAQTASKRAPFSPTMNGATTNCTSSSNSSATPPLLEKIFMIGDNPTSDIRGANAKGWESVLVETGLFHRTSTRSNDERDPAKHVFPDVERVVDAIISGSI